MKTLRVMAKGSVRVPMEDAPYRYIEGSAPVVVKRSIYYQRRVADGDLIEVKDEKKPAKTAKKETLNNEHDN